MAVNEIDQNPPDIWNNDAFRYGLLVAFLLFLVTTCYCSFNFRARRRRPFADALFISLAERARALDATGPPPDFVEAWVGPAGKPGWRDMKPLSGERLFDAPAHPPPDRVRPRWPGRQLREPDSQSAAAASAAIPTTGLQLAVLIAMPSESSRKSAPDKLDDELPLADRVGGGLAFGITLMPWDDKGL